MYTPTLLLTTFGTVGLLVLIAVTTIFLVAQAKRDNSIMDIAYGPTFLVTGVVATLLLGNQSWLTNLMLGLIAIWALRLGVRIYKKNHGQPEDARYALWRTAWSTRGQLYFLLRSYLQINVLQGLIIVFILCPLIISLTYTDANTLAYPKLLLFAGLGTLIFTIGLSIEAVADIQLDRFIARKRAGTETAPIMRTGLFRYSRRPNYFGETLVWWGLAIMTLPLPFGYIALLSPLLITFIVTKVTGPMLEKIFLERYPEEYRAYQATTSYLIPLPPRTK